jgi:hemolysin III
MEVAVRDQVEEFANAVSHGLGLVASLAAFPILVLIAMREGDAWVTLGVGIFAMTLIGVYAASTVYHSLKPGPAKDLWLRLDYAAIYLFIAGTYTPFTLGPLRGPVGWALLAAVWIIALAGIGIKFRIGPKRETLSNLAYLGLGWLVVVAIKPLVTHIGWAGLAWLFAGGLAYSIGVIFVACQKRIRYGHCIWHVFVLAGSVCHVVAVVAYGIRAS